MQGCDTGRADRDGASDFREIREALTARKNERDAILRERDEHDAESVIALNPAIVDEYRKCIRSLALTLQSGIASFDQVAGRVRDLIERVNLSPAQGGGCIVEVVSSLGSVVALASGDIRLRTSAPMTKVVAKEGFEPPTPGL